METLLRYMSFRNISGSRKRTVYQPFPVLVNSKLCISTWSLSWFIFSDRIRLSSFPLPNHHTCTQCILFHHRTVTDFISVMLCIVKVYKGLCDLVQTQTYRKHTRISSQLSSQIFFSIFDDHYHLNIGFISFMTDTSPRSIPIGSLTCSPFYLFFALSRYLKTSGKNLLDRAKLPLYCS